MKIVKLMLAAGVLSLTACGESDKDSSSTSGSTEALVQKNVEEVAILDVNNIPLNGASIQILTEEEWQKLQAAQPKAAMLMVSDEGESLFPSVSNLPTAQAFTGPSYMSNAQGIVQLPKLLAGNYYVLITKNGQSNVSAFLISSLNTNKKIVINTALNCLDTQCQTLSANPVNDAVIGTLSGQIVFKGKPAPNVQVSLSGGAATNGAFVSAITDVNGYFTLSFNVSNELLNALKNATLTISGSGYQTIIKKVKVIASSASGYQFEVLPETSQMDAVWRETFEVDSATRNAWTVAIPMVENVNWQLLSKGHGIINSQIEKTVHLAPNDQSQGAVPEVLQGNYAYWYGDKVNGNFVGELAVSGSEDSSFDGGRSKQENMGELISPVIDLSQQKAPLSLSFKTWWEIESVNPNNQGFDLMNILVSTDGGQTFKVVARLNPLADPSTEYERAPIPYSNMGFNLAPAAVQQEAISLDEYAGNAKVQIKFQFQTIDHLYNGFRGWMIDDIVIQKKIGTFPLFDETVNSGGEDGDTEASQLSKAQYSKTAQVMLQSTKAYSRWAEEPRRK